MSIRRHAHALELWIAAIVVAIVFAASFMYEVMRSDTLPTPPTAPAKVVQGTPPPPPPPPPPPGKGNRR